MTVDYTSGIMPLHAVHKPPFTIESPGYEKVPGEAIPRRHPRAKDGLINRPAPEVANVFDIVKRSARLYPNHRASGYRKLVKIHKEVKKVPKTVDGETRQVDKEWVFFELSDYHYYTYKEYEQIVIKLGAGMRHLGLDSTKKVHLFATTSTNWLTLSQGACSQSIVMVTAYDTLGVDGLKHSLVQTQASMMYTDPHLLPTLSKALEGNESVKTIIVNTACIFGELERIEEFKDSHPHLKVITWEDLVKLGEEHPCEPTVPDPADPYCVMYTSGSSGTPKGVIISHEALIAGVAGLLVCIDECVSDKEDVLMYLPLAHIFEMALENLVCFIGGTLGYGSPRTLSDTSMKNCTGDMQAFKPTVLVGVPQVWETVKKGIESKVKSSSAIIRSLFWGAYGYKSFMINHKLPFASILDGIVFSKVREMTGGRLRFVMNGASGISAGTKEFMSLVLAPMLAGYGLTETCASGSLGCPLEFTPNAIGPVPASLEAKLVAMPDLGYNTDGVKVPQGEVYFKGKALMTEYYDNKEETSKAFTEDGWLKTGDIGEFDENGHLRIIDRAKNLIKMPGGEYIALEKVEAVYRGSQTVANIMVYADEEHNRPIAIIMPNAAVVGAKAKELGVDEHNMAHDSKVNDWVLKDLQATGKRAGLAGMEIISGVVITDTEWTPDSGLVTATQKLNRRALKEAFKKEIDATLK